MSSSPSSDASASAAPEARAADPSDASGRKIAVVTGANRGIGRAIAGQLGTRGHQVICLCRTEERARETADELAQEVGRKAFGWAHADLTRPHQIEAAAKSIRERHPTIDLLMNNAGYSTLEYRESEEGVEETLAINHLGTVATGLLDDLIGSSLLATPFRALARLIAKGPSEGAETPIHVATAPKLEGSSGGYFVKKERRDPRPVAEDRKVQAEARRWSAELAGVDWGARVDDILAEGGDR